MALRLSVSGQESCLTQQTGLLLSILCRGYMTDWMPVSLERTTADKDMMCRIVMLMACLPVTADGIQAADAVTTA